MLLLVGRGQMAGRFPRRAIMSTSGFQPDQVFPQHQSMGRYAMLEGAAHAEDKTFEVMAVVL